MTVLLIDAWVDLVCPNCHATERVRPLPPNSSRMHTCPALHMLSAPMVPAGSDCKVVAVERGDYLNGAEQRTGDDGRPYTGVITERADGSNDMHVFAEVAIFGGRAGAVD